ncbi:LysM domain-containing protein [Kitasatospora sp. NPDC049285]|uniref:LysM domain-containing protein n=1 Tax=Kitasatospora sp. NPDC049285 TaxID=3157096 RepID=UPI00342DDCC7
MPTTPGPAPEAPASGMGGGLAARVGGQRNLAVLAAGGTVAVVALLAGRKRKAAAGDATNTSAVQAAGSGFDSGPYDMWNAWQQEYEGLQKEISDLRNKPGTTAPPITSVVTKIPTPVPVPIQRPPRPAPAPTPAPVQQPPRPQTVWYTAHSGDTYSGLAAKYGHNANELWDYQLQPGIRPADTQATLRTRGIDHALFNGSSVAIPGGWNLQ